MSVISERGRLVVTRVEVVLKEASSENDTLEDCVVVEVCPESIDENERVSEEDKPRTAIDLENVDINEVA